VCGQAYQQYQTIESGEASRALRYMILAKIMLNQPGNSSPVVVLVSAQLSSIPFLQSM
jgi:hypothetical protein